MKYKSISKKPMNIAFLWALGYLILGMLWILITDTLSFLLFQDSAILTTFQTYKGWFFVLMSSIIVFLLAKRISKKQSKLSLNSEKLQNILDSVNDAIFIQEGTAGKIIDVNEKACEMYGYTKNEIKKLDIETLSGEHQLFNNESARRILDRAREGIPQIFEWKAKNKNGREFWVEGNINYSTIHEHPMFIVTVRNIENRKQVEKDLNNIFTLSNDLMCTATIEDARFIRINPAFIRTLGWSEEELTSQSFLNFIHEDDIDSTRHILEDALKKDKTVINFENRYRCKDGSYRWLEWNSHPVTEDGYVYGIAHDITERKNNEHELAKYRTNLEKLVAERTKELQGKNEELEEKNRELEHFNKLFIGREFRINELKQKIRELEDKISKA